MRPEMIRNLIAPADVGAGNIIAARSIINELPVQEREAIVRFYVLAQSSQKICHDLRLDEKQFDAIKVRMRTAYMKIINREAQ